MSSCWLEFSRFVMLRATTARFKRNSDGAEDVIAEAADKLLEMARLPELKPED